MVQIIEARGLGGSGGEGFALGPEQNVFPGADRAAAASARNTFFLNNPTILTEYNEDTNLNIRLEYMDGNRSVAVYQVRNSAGSAWLDNSSAIGIQGAPGTDGTANVPGLTSGEFVMGDGSGALLPASMFERSGRIDVGKDLMSGASRLGVQAGMISSDGETVMFESLATGRRFVPAAREVLEDGTGVPFSTSYSPVESVAFQPRSDIEISGTDVGFSIRELTQALVLRWIIATSGTGSFYFIAHRGTSASDPQIFTSHSEADIASGNVYDLTRADRTFPTVFSMEEGVDYFIRLVSPDATPFTLRGTVVTQADVNNPESLFTVAGEQAPEFTTAFQVEAPEALLTQSDRDELQSQITALQNSAFNSGRAFDVFQDGFTIDRTNIAQHEDINNIYAAKNDKLITTTTRPDILLPDDAEIAAAGEPYPVTFEFTHLGGSARFEDRNLLRFFAGSTLLETVFRDQVVIVTKPAAGEDYTFQVSDFDPTVVLLPSGTFVLKGDTPINNIATISSELSGVTIIKGNAFRVETGGEWSGFDVPNMSVLVALADSPSLANSPTNNDWLLLENGRVNVDVAMLLANFERTGIVYQATRNIKVHPDNVTVFNQMATGTPVTRQIGSNVQGFNRQIRFDNVPLQFADLVGGRLDIMFSQVLTTQRGFEPEPLTLDIVYGATTFTFDTSGVPFDGQPVRLSIEIPPEDYSAILNTNASFRWNHNFRGDLFNGSYTVSAALNTATGTLHDPINSLIQQADLVLKSDLENQIRLLQGDVSANANTFQQIEPRISPLVDLPISTPAGDALFIDSTGVDAFPSDLSTLTSVSEANPRFTGGSTALFVAILPPGNFALNNITANSVVVLDNSEPTVELGESVTFNGLVYFVYRVTGLTSGDVYEVDRQTFEQVVSWANDIQNLQGDVARIDAELEHAILGLSDDVVHVLEGLTVTEESTPSIAATDYNNQLSGATSTTQSVFYEPSPVAGGSGLKASKPLSDLTGDQVQRKLLYIPEGVSFNNQASYVTAFDGTIGRDLISYANGVFSANVFVPAIPAGTSTHTVYPAPSNRVSGEGIWQAVEALTFVNGVPVPEADELFFTRNVPNAPVTLNIAYRGHANGNLFGAGTATLANVGGTAGPSTTFTLNAGSETATVEVRYFASTRRIRVSVTERVNSGLPTINDIQVILSFDETRTVQATSATTRQVAIESVSDGWQVFAFRPASSGNLAIVGDNLEIDTGYSFATLFGAGLGGHIVVAEETATFLNFEDFTPIHSTVADLENHASLPQFGLFSTTYTEETDLNIPVTIKPSGLNVSDLPTSAAGLATGDVWFNGTSFQFV